jgi:Xaa-Pro aminopeptidase
MIENRLVSPNRRSEQYPRFSEEEFNRRHDAVRDWMDSNDLDVLVIYANGGLLGGNSTNIHYLSNYSGMFMSYMVFFADPDRSPTIYCGLSNHLQFIAEISVVSDIRLMIPDPPEQLADRIAEAGLTGGNTGIVALDPRYKYSIPYEHRIELEDRLEGKLRDKTGSFVNEVHSVKSDEEIEWIKKAAEYCDLGMKALAETAEPGVKEYELEAALKNAYLKEGGETSFTFINSAPMEGAQPGEAITWKEPSSRTLESGDIVSTEFSASHHGYSSQVHRPIAVGQSPTDEYEEMWDLALETYENMLGALKPGNTSKDVAEATAPIEDSEYKIYDVMLHGFGNAYIHPFIGTPSSNYWPGGDDPLTKGWEFKENMTVVIQPNLCDENETKCFQLGTTVAIREHGAEVLQEYPVEFVQP